MSKCAAQPTDQRHVLNLSGFADPPWRLQLVPSVSASSTANLVPYSGNLANPATFDQPGGRVNF
jgi:hypothetical protein